LDSDLEWLPERADWHQELAATRALGPSRLDEALRRFAALASCRLDLALTVKLDRAVQAHVSRASEEGLAPSALTPVRLALLGSSTIGHLVPGIRVAGLRRGLLIHTYEAPYAMWRQEVADGTSGLHAFGPDAVLLALDARHLVELERAENPGSALRRLRDAWRTVQHHLHCAVLQQSALPVLPPVLGHAEQLLKGSPAAILERLNADLPSAAQAEGVHLLAIHRVAAEQGLARWHSQSLWFRARQEVHPAMSPVYGDQVARVLAALWGKTAKCLVLDLDHTLWGGGIGDDGLAGIVVGQGSAVGEAHLELQRYALALRDRGILLAVCSKNDESNALLPFEQHPDMLLRRDHIACFVANWEDKATNLRRIAKQLNLGLDALVFVDDNPAERGLIRRELPEVHVPELPEDPACFVTTLAAAGYFESVGITAEDRSRAALYSRTAANPDTATSSGHADADEDKHTSLDDYLASLNMQLEARPFDNAGRARIVQLINKTNQFNLTTRRVLDGEVNRLASDSHAVTLQLRLRDIYGDHGMISVIAAESASLHSELAEGSAPGDLLIAHWLMSCRIFGRQVEYAAMNLLAEQARACGARRLFGMYLPTAKNSMVRGLYRQLGFESIQQNADGRSVWVLDLQTYKPLATHITTHAAAFALQPLG
jgi:FkbH-like protein